MHDFTVKFRGVRGSHPTPEKKFMEYGGNTACVEVNVGGHLIILDAGTGIISLGDELIKSHIASAEDIFTRKPVDVTILLSHIHQDHIQGLNFFKPANVMTTTMNILGFSGYNEDLEQSLSELLYGKSFPLTIYDVTADFHISDISETDVVVLTPDSNKPKIKRICSSEDLVPKDDEVIISCLKSTSHPQTGIICFKIAYKNKSMIYATDKECFIGMDKKLTLFARNTDLLIHDSQYTTEDYLSPVSSKQGYGHSTFEMAYEVFQVSQAQKLVFFHYDPSYDDDKLNSIAKYYIDKNPNCIMSKEGMEICL